MCLNKANGSLLTLIRACGVRPDRIFVHSVQRHRNKGTCDLLAEKLVIGGKMVLAITTKS